MYKVGKRNLILEDNNRPNWLASGCRPLITEIWYPASDDVETTGYSFGSPEPLFQFDAVAENADLNGDVGQYPLIMLSHGTGGSALGMGWLGHYLAAHGYIAAAVNHHGNTAIETYTARGFLLWWERATDITVVIDRLLNEIGEFKHRIDGTRIAVAGFSQGGNTAILLAGGRCSLENFNAFCRSDKRDSICDGPREFPIKDIDIDELLHSDSIYLESFNRHHHSYRDTRIRAAFTMAPAIGMAFTAQGLSEIEIPVHIVVTEIDNEVPPVTNAHYFDQHIESAELEVLPGDADHYVFLCEATRKGKVLDPYICVDADSVNRRKIHQKVAAGAVSFFTRAFN